MRGNGFKLKETEYKWKEDFFYYECGRTLKQCSTEKVAQRGGRCPLHGQVGECSEQPDLVEGDWTNGR